MRIPTWRLVLTGSAILVLGVVSVGLVQAAPQAATQATTAALEQPATDPELAALAANHPILRRLAAWRHLVHGTVTFDRGDKGLVTVQFDGGSISAIGNDTITIAETGGTSVTVRTDAETRVRKDGRPSQLDKLAVGDTVIAVSEVQNGQANALAKLVVVPRAPRP